MQPRDEGTGRTIYAVSAISCDVDTGTGAQDAPYCLIQNAVNAAVRGDTVQITGSTGYFSQESVTVKTSGIRIVGIGGQAWINSSGQRPALELDGVTDVTVSNMMLESYGTPAVVIKGSSNIKLDGDYVDLNPNTHGVDALTIDGASSNVTVSRTYVDAGFWGAGPAASGISVASGASDITLAGNVLAATGITATGVAGLDVTGNTIQRACASAIDIQGASTGVHLENNLLEDTNPNTDYMFGGFKSQCTAAQQTWAPDITVSEGSSAGTTADYNAFYIHGDDATAPYSWSGTTYPTLAAFQAGAAQGAHDVIDTKKANGAYLRANKSANVDMLLVPGSAAINSADPNAPGRLGSDFYGVSPYTSRGAVQYVNPNAQLAVALSGTHTSAYAISLNADVTTALVPITAKVSWGDGTTSNPDVYGSGRVTLPHRYAKLGTYTITVTVADNVGNTVSNTVTARTAGSAYTAYGPTRVLDTRTGTGAPKAKAKAHAVTKVQIGGNGGIPAGVTAVVLNVTVTRADGFGYITAYGDGDARPSTSNVNFTAGQTVPNLVIVPVGANGYVDLYNGASATVDLIADVAGYFTQSASSGYTPVSPARLVDTRNGTGVAKGQIGANGSFAAQIAGNSKGHLPASGVTAVALNVTVTGSKGSGFLTVYPDGGKTPLASNINYGTNQTIANAVIVPVGADGKIRVFNGSTRSTDVLVDVVGYYSAASKSAYLPVDPVRVLDTRASYWHSGPMYPGGYIYTPLGADEPDITAFALNTTVTDTKGAGFLTVSPDPYSEYQYESGSAGWPTRPGVSTLNWLRGQTVPNLVQASPGPYGIIDFWNSGTGSVNLVIDAFGYYQND